MTAPSLPADLQALRALLDEPGLDDAASRRLASVHLALIERRLAHGVYREARTARPLSAFVSRCLSVMTGVSHQLAKG